jgi:hypothetical protein
MNRKKLLQKQRLDQNCMYLDRTIDAKKTYLSTYMTFQLLSIFLLRNYCISYFLTKTELGYTLCRTFQKYLPKIFQTFLHVKNITLESYI